MSSARPPQDHSYAGPQDRGYQQDYQQRPYTKKKSFLSELFDD
jgi:Zn-finger nucleic acid-binding protein